MNAALNATASSLSTEVDRRVDFAIITIKEEEFTAVLDQFGARDGRTPHMIERGNRDYVMMRIPVAEGSEGAGVHITVAVTRCSTQGNGVSQDVTRDIISDLSPRWILLVGIAGGVPAAEFSLGDVVLNSLVLDFTVEAVKQSDDANVSAERSFAVNAHPPHYQVENFVAIVSGHAQTLGEWFDLTIQQPAGRESLPCPPIPLDPTKLVGDAEWQNEVRVSLEARLHRAEQRPRVVGMPIASSDRLIKDSEIVRTWQKVARQFKAIEMESAGVHIAARARGATRPGIPILCIRGISDIVGYKRNEAWTVYACHAAASFACAVVKSGCLEQPKRPTPEILSEEVSDPDIPTVIATPTLDSNAVRSEWAPPAETVKIIREHVQVSDPSVLFSLDRAVKAAELACTQAAAAERASERARQAVAEFVPRELPDRVASPMLVRPRVSADGLGAVLWDSGDEYFGQVNARGAMGVGVCKIYHLSRKLSPQQVAYYRGQMWNSQLGTFGVWESDGGLTFAGEWIDERPRVGYMTSSAESEVCKFDLYFGQMLQFGDRVWLPDGRGASYRHRYKELVIGVFRRGVPSRACKVIRLDR